MSSIIRLLLIPYIFVLSLAFAVNIKISVVLLSVSVFSLLFFHFLEAGFITVLFCVPFDRLLIIGGQLTVTKVFILLTIAAMAAHVLLSKDATPITSLYRRKTSLLIIAYLVISFVSLVNARDLNEGVLLLIRRASVVVLYFMVLCFVRNRASLNRAINTVLIASFFVAVLGMYEFTSGDQVLSESQRGDELAVTTEGSQRIQGCAGNSNFHAAVLAMLLPLGLTRALQARGIRQMVMAYGLVFLFVVNIYATNTRLGVLGMILSFTGVFVLSDIRLKYLKLFGAGVGLISLMLILSLDPNRFSTDRFTGDSGGKTVEYRVGWMLMSFEMGKNHPLLGVGLGNYFPEYNEYRRAAPDLVPRGRIKNHNGIMQVFAEMGVVGLSVFLALLLCVPIEIYTSTIHQRGDRELVQLRNGLLVGYAVYVLMIGIIPVLEHEVAWIGIGLAIALGDIPPATKTAKKESIGSIHTAVPAVYSSI